MSDKIKINIDSSINCYAFEDIDLNQGKLKISYIELSENLILLDKSYYKTKENFEEENKTCFVGEFDSSKLDFSYEPMEPSKEFRIILNGDLDFFCEDNIGEFKKLNEPIGTSVSISLVSNDGIQDDLSTSQIDFCDIKKI
jgi:hypothetical protein